MRQIVIKYLEQHCPFDRVQLEEMSDQSLLNAYVTCFEVGHIFNES